MNSYTQKLNGMGQSNWLVAGATLLAIALCVPVTAQPPGGRGGPDRGADSARPSRGGPQAPGQRSRQRAGQSAGQLGLAMLLRVPEVQAELSITDEQKEQLREKAREMMKELREQYGNRSRGRRGPGAKPKKPANGEKAADTEATATESTDAEATVADSTDAKPTDPRTKIREQVEAGLAEILSTEQLNRLKEIHVQIVIDKMGPRALAGGPLGKEIGVTDEQREAMREKTKEARKQMREKLKEQAIEARAKLKEQVSEARKEMQEDILSILTSEQRNQLEALKGEAFDMPEIDLPRQGNARRGPGQGRPGQGGFDGPPRGGDQGRNGGGRGRGGPGRGQGRPGPK